jgi:hypothetical protein
MNVPPVTPRNVARVMLGVATAVFIARIILHLINPGTLQ